MIYVPNECMHRHPHRSPPFLQVGSRRQPRLRQHGTADFDSLHHFLLSAGCETVAYVCLVGLIENETVWFNLCICACCMFWLCSFFFFFFSRTLARKTSEVSRSDPYPYISPSAHGPVASSHNIALPPVTLFFLFFSFFFFSYFFFFLFFFFFFFFSYFFFSFLCSCYIV